MDQQLIARAKIQVQKPATEVFDAIGNTEGWANFLACLKAWMEYGINFRKGAFAYLSSSPS